MEFPASTAHKKLRSEPKTISVSVNAMDEGGKNQPVKYREKEKHSKQGRKSGIRGRSPLRHILIVLAFFCTVLIFRQSNTTQLQLSLQSFSTKPTDTLVVYVYSNTDPEYQANLKYFLKTGVRADDGCDYVVIIQEGEGVEDTYDLPSTPPNVRFVRHANECFDWGTFGWALEHKLVDIRKYKYFIMLNSSVRGPFLPPYWPSNLHWSDGLTSRLNQEVRLVGSTISCEGSWKGGVLTGEKRQNPHVQSYVVAMDDVALNLMRQDSTVLKCYKQYHDAVWYGEMGSSAVILRAGYNIDALMVRYQGIDWRQTENWGCNGALNPYAEHMYDGIDVSPFEVMFVKFKEFLLEANWTVAMQSKKYSEWSMHEDKNIRENEYTAKKEQLRMAKIVGMRQRGDACFDYDLYRQRNPDLPKWGKKDLWEHFVKHGQHEGRVFRFLCKSSPSTAIATATGTAATPVTLGNLAAQGQGGSGAGSTADDALHATQTTNTGPPDPQEKQSPETAAGQQRKGHNTILSPLLAGGTDGQAEQMQGRGDALSGQQVQQGQGGSSGAIEQASGGMITAQQQVQANGIMQQQSGREQGAGSEGHGWLGQGEAAAYQQESQGEGAYQQQGQDQVAAQQGEANLRQGQGQVAAQQQEQGQVAAQQQGHDQDVVRTQQSQGQGLSQVAAGDTQQPRGLDPSRHQQTLVVAANGASLQQAERSEGRQML